MRQGFERPRKWPQGFCRSRHRNAGSIQLNGITGVDVGTTGNNYSMDVLDRASSFENLHAFAPDEVAEVDIGGDPQAAPSLFADVLHQAGLGRTDWPAQPTL